MSKLIQNWTIHQGIAQPVPNIPAQPQLGPPMQEMSKITSNSWTI